MSGSPVGGKFRGAAALVTREPVPVSSSLLFKSLADTFEVLAGQSKSRAGLGGQLALGFRNWWVKSQKWWVKVVGHVYMY